MGKGRAGAENHLAPIDNRLVVDGHGEMQGHTHYESRPATCGLCGVRFEFTAAAQKCGRRASRAVVLNSPGMEKAYERMYFFGVTCGRSESATS